MRKKEIIIWNCIFALFFVFVSVNSPWRPSDELLLLTPDSKSYFFTGKEFFESYAGSYSIIRPFFYSTFLYLVHGLGGAWLVVVLQFGFWLLSANFILVTLMKRLSSKKLTYVFILFYVGNLSLISYAFHGLTELITTLFIAWIVYLLYKEESQKLTLFLYLKILVILAILTVIKPLFQYPFLLFLLFGLVFFAKHFLPWRKYFFLLILTVSPVILQLAFMKAKHNQLKISTIDSYTLDTYLIAQTIREVDKTSDITLTQNRALNFTKQERNEFLWKHKTELIKLFFMNVKENVDAYESNFLLNKKYTTDSYYKNMDVYNHILYLISLPIVFVFSFLFFIDLIKKRLKEHWKMYFIGVLLYYVVFSSGISFWQADRLIIFTIPLWILLYAILLSRLLFFMQNSRNLKAG